MKKRIMKMLPVIFIIGVTICLSLIMYSKILSREKERCWQILSDSVESVNKSITTKFKDETSKLHMLADIMMQDGKIEREQIAYMHLDKIQQTTIFSRIDIIYPDNTLILENGEKEEVDLNVSFEKIAARGEHISKRRKDFKTGKESLYYCVPITVENETKAILIGVIESEQLKEIFHPTIYDERANICIIDSDDGNFIMDSWHKELGNAYDMEERTPLKGYEGINFRDETKKNEPGVFAFESKTNGKGTYIYYVPMGMFNWQLSVFAQEDIIFEDLLYLRRLLIIIGSVEIVLLLIYFIGNLITVNQLQRSKNEIEKQKEMLQIVSYYDMLTGLFNRNKYIHMLDECGKKELQNAGVVYVDLNGLKQINDANSHEAGDAFIRNAANVIKDIFPDKGYRIGGDEFVVLAFNMESDVFAGKIEKLEAAMKQSKVSASIGFKWKEKCDNLNLILREAEQIMYEEKERYYMTHDRIR